MEKLLDMAKKVSDSAEIFTLEHSNNSVTYKNARLHEIESAFQSGLSLRIMKDGKQGFAYTRNLTNRQELLDNALLSLKGGVEADFEFPLTQRVPTLDTYDKSLESLTSSQMAEEGQRVCDILKSKTGTEILLTNVRHIESARIINSSGTDLSSRNSFYVQYAMAVFPGSGSGVYRIFQNKGFAPMPDEYMNEIVERFNICKKDVRIKSGRMKVLFMPNSMVALTWRILSGTNSRSLYEKTSPVAGKAGEKLLSANLTIYDDPLDTRFPGGRAFDDEGVACDSLTIIENGVLKNFYYDLNYAGKLKYESTGHGFKTSQWGGDVITLKPVPALKHLRIRAGSESFTELVNSIDKGLIVEGAMGAHSGNIPNGDYSIGVSPGLYVENGEIIGRVKDTMVAGNIYQTLNNVVEVGNTLYPALGDSWVPPILCADVSVSTNN